ncbi:MAG: prolipoprotein diacylglyceryl transferase [Lachnospiraceae bacterium]|nr:prolipoprotein diacylglyceryl transferase [Lachnospiraceae bacterium]
MNPYVVKDLFGIKGLNIAWYGVIIGVGLLAGVAVAVWRANKKGLKADLIYDYTLWAMPVAVIGARGYYVLFQWDYYKEHLSKIAMITEGGLAIYGAVIASILVAVLFCRRNKISFLLFANLTIPCLALGQAIGRWANFVNQEAYGRLITEERLQFFPYAVYIERASEWHQATFFYESIWCILLFFALLLLGSRDDTLKYTFSAYCIGYGIGRFLIEGLRTDSLYIGGTIRVSQLVSVLLIFLGTAVAVLIKAKHNQAVPYQGKYSS